MSASRGLPTVSIRVVNWTQAIIGSPIPYAVPFDGLPGNPRPAYLRHGRHAAIDLVTRGTNSQWPCESESRIRAASGLNTAAIHSQRIGCDADSIRVSVLRLYQVIEFQALVACLAKARHSIAAPGCPTSAVAHTEIQCRSPGHLDRIGEAYADSDLLACSIGVTTLWIAIDRHRVRPPACGRAAVPGYECCCHWNLNTCLGPGGFPRAAAGLQDRQQAPVSCVEHHAGGVRRDGNLLPRRCPNGPIPAGWQ